MVVVSHPGTQHSWQVARALQDYGILQKYITGYYDVLSDSNSRLAETRRRILGKAIERELRRRSGCRLERRYVELVPFYEGIYVAVSRIPALKGLSSPVLRWRNRKFDSYVSRRLAELKPKAVLCYPDAALSTFRAAKTLGIKTILDVPVAHPSLGNEILQSEIHLKPNFADSIPSLETAGQRACQWNEELGLADLVLVGSPFVRESLARCPKPMGRIEVIPYGVDVEAFAPVPRPSGNNGTVALIFVGQLSQRKGLSYLMEAFRTIGSKSVTLTLVGGVVGSGRWMADYSDQFRHIPNVPRSHVPTILRNADVFVYPSLLEGSALAVYEALACGLPVITTPSAGSVVTDGLDGLIVPTSNERELAKAMRHLIENNPERTAMGMAARQTALRYTWATYRKSVSSKIADLIH